MSHVWEWLIVAVALALVARGTYAITDDVCEWLRRRYRARRRVR